jgi:hypothetical protein
MTPQARLLAAAVTATLLATVVLKSPGQEPATSKQAYVRTGQEATLSGAVTFIGKVPKALKIDMSADPTCAEGNVGPTTEWFVVSNDRLSNVLVYVSAGATIDNYSFEAPSTAIVMEHKGCRYEPHVLGLQVNQPLMIINSDNTHHNTHPTPKSNAEWNQTQPEGAPPLVKTFARPELLIQFNCNQHHWEKAYVSVFKHPFFAVSDVDGNFKIEGLPPGSYKITAWHEKLGEKTVEVVVVPGESKSLAFSFAGADLAHQ